MRRAFMRDPNEAQIVSGLRALGCSVQQLNARDCPDLIVGHRGVTHIMEIKRPHGVRGGSSQKGQRLSEGQELWRDRWRGSPVHVIRTLDDALQVLGIKVSTTVVQPGEF